MAVTVSGNKEKTAADYQKLQMQYSAVNHEEVLDKIQELQEIGESEAYHLLMSRYQNNGFFELRREQLCSEETFPQMKLYQRRWLYDMIQGYKRYGKRQFWHSICAASSRWRRWDS